MAAVRAFGLFCESVREEAGGTHSIVGILPDNMTLQKVPVALPKLSLYVRIVVEAGANPGPLAVWIEFPNGEKREIQKIDQQVVESSRASVAEAGGPLVGFIAHAAFPQFPVTAYGRITALVRAGDEEMICGFLNVREPAASAAPAKPA